MEFASFLAGERWSDHPSCTHPLLAELARRINDRMSDGDRQLLIPMIPSVVGRRGDEYTWIRLPVALAAWPLLDVPEETQRVLAGGLMGAERLCAEAGPDLDDARLEARAALDLVPGAVAWVNSLCVRPQITPRLFTDRCAPTIIRCAVDGITRSGTSDSAERLCELIEVAIAACPAPQPAEREHLVAEAS